MKKADVVERKMDNDLMGVDLQLFSAPSAADLMIGAGKVFFRRWEDGEKTVFRHLGNCPDFKMTPSIEKITKYSSMDCAKETYAEAVKSMGYTANITLDEFNPFNLSLGLYGEEGLEEQASQTVQNETYKVAVGAMLQVPHKNIENVVLAPITGKPASIGPATHFVQDHTPGTAVVTSGGVYTGSTTGAYYIEITKANTAAGNVADAEFTWKKGLAGAASSPVVVDGSAQPLAEGVTVAFAAGSSGQDLVAGEVYEIKVTAASSVYTAGRDYVLDKSMLRGGMILIPETSTIPNGTNVRISYKVPARKYPKIMGGTAQKIEGDMMFIGDPKHGRPYVLEIWHVNLTPNGEIGFITEEWGSFTLDMTVLSDRMSHPEEPFFKLVNTD